MNLPAGLERGEVWTVAKARRKAPREPVTILDFISYAAIRFEKAKLAFGQGARDAVEEAMFLVAETLKLPVNRIRPFLKARVAASERPHLFALVQRRIRTRVPAAYLMNCAYLQDKRFFIDRRVIVPRSYLAEILYGDLFGGEQPLIDPAGVTRVLDLCTGSGCLAIVACDVFPNAAVDAVDLSPGALQVAEINVTRHGLKDRITLLKGDLFEPAGEAVYDVILANPPYVDAKAVSELPPEYKHEPHLALAGGTDGLDIVRRILAEAPNHLSSYGGLLCEVGRGGDILQSRYPNIDFLWLDTEESSGEVFWITAAALQQLRG